MYFEVFIFRYEHHIEVWIEIPHCF